jgi:hypothetical protein
MRILMLAQSYPPIGGGQEGHVRNLNIGLAHQGHDVPLPQPVSLDRPRMASAANTGRPHPRPRSQ